MLPNNMLGIQNGFLKTLNDFKKNCNSVNTFCLKVTFLFGMYFLSILQATPGQREGKKKRSLGSTCLIMKRNILFLTHFLTIFLPSKKKSNKNNILLDCIVLLHIFSFKLHVTKE